MPEGPEIHLSARFINDRCQDTIFAGPIVKSEVSTKNPDIAFENEGYTIKALARGKELKVFITDIKQGSKNSTHILFRFGMSGGFRISDVQDIPKHSHLRFFTKSGKSVLNFVDYRRFGRWLQNEEWGKDRGPDPITEYQDFRSNVLDNLENVAFKKPICEVMLNQKYFNGIGNYLRAEILHRLKISPFDPANEILQPIQKIAPSSSSKSPVDRINKKGGKNWDILELCNIVPNEVLKIGDGGKWYGGAEGHSEFENWLSCYAQEGMSNLVDSNKRTIWFAPETKPGKLAPKYAKSRKGKKYMPKKEENQKVTKEIVVTTQGQQSEMKKQSPKNTETNEKDSSTNRHQAALKRGAKKTSINEKKILPKRNRRAL